MEGEAPVSLSLSPPLSLSACINGASLLGSKTYTEDAEEDHEDFWGGGGNEKLPAKPTGTSVKNFMSTDTVY